MFNPGANALVSSSMDQVDEITEQVFEANEEHHTIQMIVDVPTNLLWFEDLPTSAFDLIRPFLNTWESNHLTQQLAVDLYPRHAYIVVDINNHQYDYYTAHEQTFTVPVYILHLSRSSKWTFFRRAVNDKMIPVAVAELHRWNGQNPLPFWQTISRDRCIYRLACRT